MLQKFEPTWLPAAVARCWGIKKSLKTAAARHLHGREMPTSDRSATTAESPRPGHTRQDVLLILDVDVAEA